MTAESSRFLDLALFWCFENNFFLLESWNIKLNFGTFYVGGCWGQPMALFWKLDVETQISTPPEATRHHNSTKLLILLPLRAIYLRPFQSDTPCTWPFKSNKFSEKLWPHFVLRFSSSGYPTKVYYFSWSKLLLHHHPSSYLRDCQSKSSCYYGNLVGYLLTI